MLLALTLALLCSAPQTKVIYGRPVTQDEFAKVKEQLAPNPEFKSQNSFSRVRLQHLKTRFEGKPTVFADDPPFDGARAKQAVERFKKQASVFHVAFDQAYVDVDPPTFVFPPDLQIRVESLNLETKPPVTLAAGTRPEFSSVASEGQSLARYAFPLPANDTRSDIKSGKAVFAVTLPSDYEVVTLTPSKPTASGFTLVTLDADHFVVSFDRNDGLDFEVDVVDANDKALQQMSIGGVTKDTLRMRTIATKTWDELPAEVPLPAQGTIDVGFHGPATRVVLHKAKAMQTVKLSSVWAAD